MGVFNAPLRFGSVVSSLQTLRYYCERLYRCEQDSSLLIFHTKCNYGIAVHDYELSKRKTAGKIEMLSKKLIVGGTEMVDSEIRRQSQPNSSNG